MKQYLKSIEQDANLSRRGTMETIDHFKNGVRKNWYPDLLEVIIHNKTLKNYEKREMGNNQVNEYKNISIIKINHI
jgi:hypothetical protein